MWKPTNNRTLCVMLPLFAALASSSCNRPAAHAFTPSSANTAVTAKSGSTPTTAKAKANLPARKKLAADQVAFSEGYPQIERDADGISTGHVLILMEHTFGKDAHISDFRLLTSPTQGGEQKTYGPLDERKGRIGRVDPADETGILPVALPVPVGSHGVQLHATVSYLGEDGKLKHDTYASVTVTLVMPAMVAERAEPSEPPTTPASKK